MLMIPYRAAKLAILQKQIAKTHHKDRKGRQKKLPAH